MTTPDLIVALEAVRQLSTEVFFVLLLSQFAGYVLATIFSLDLLGILLAVLVRRYAERHLAIWPMAMRIDRKPPYGPQDRRVVFETFLYGLRASGITPPPSPPSPPGP